MKIFILNGQGRSGKQTFVDTIISTFPSEKIFYYSIIDAIKEIAWATCWDHKKNKKGRKFLYDLKVAFDSYCDFSFMNVLFKTTEILTKHPNCCIFINMREIKDIERFKTIFPQTKTILIIRGEEKNFGNVADDDVFNYKYDYVIPNHGSLEKFKETSIKFGKEMLFEEDENE